MRIPLDYYRILGVPTQATTEQLTQAYSDRLRQMVRREYSQRACDRRKELIDKAFSVLSDPKQRSHYDASLSGKLENISESNLEVVDNYNPSLEIDSEQIIGALIILQELGEYELILKLGESLLLDRLENNPKQDLIFTLAISYLELGREQWQQGEYETAALSLDKAQKLLMTENLFFNLSEEIKTDTYKLRPYRIIELLAQSENNIVQRNKGLQLLKEMLQERDGIEGKGDDKSGLSVDDFLRFIQQLQTYLTVTEQQELFELEAQRPSAVATYLAFYALLAKGFTEKQPSLIVRAQAMLKPLSKRQDMYLEQAVCCLLLGQTNEAILALENSQEKDSLKFIQQNSANSPDLLPGLCLYGERWLQTDVFSHFRDLVKKQASLQEYFANNQVQTYLEGLGLHESETHTTSIKSCEENLSEQNKETFELPQSYEKIAISSMPNTQTTSSNLSTAQRESMDKSNRRLNRRDRRRRLSHKHNVDTNGQQELLLPPITRSIENTELKRKKRNPIKPLLPFAIFATLGMGLFLLAYNLFNREPQQEEINTQIIIKLNNPPVTIPTVTPNTQAQQVTKPHKKSLDKETAKQVILSWLSAKAKAFGSTHQLEGLNNILTEPLLSQWRTTAQQLKNSNSYRTYQHNVEVRSLNINQNSPNQAKVEAKVTEVSKYFYNSQEDPSQSYNSKLLVNYELVRINEKWLIKDIKIISVIND